MIVTQNQQCDETFNLPHSLIMHLPSAFLTDKSSKNWISGNQNQGRFDLTSCDSWFTISFWNSTTEFFHEPFQNKTKRKNFLGIINGSVKFK